MMGCEDGLTSILFVGLWPRLKLNKFPKCAVDDDEGNVEDVANSGIIIFSFI